MSWQRWLFVLAIIVFAIAQYGLAVYALLDLRARPRVRWDNKVGWALVILTVPLAGSLIYSVYGPTSFIPRPNRPPRQGVATLDEHDLHDPGR